MPEETRVDAVLGTLVWNADLEWWEGQADIAGVPIRFSLSQPEDGGSAAAPNIEKARSVIAFLREHEPEARLVASDELLEIYNAEWNDGPALSDEEFMARLILDDLSIADDGTAEVFYRDDGLFAGHAVVVTIDENGNFADADVAG